MTTELKDIVMDYIQQNQNLPFFLNISCPYCYTRFDIFLALSIRNEEIVDKLICPDCKKNIGKTDEDYKLQTTKNIEDRTKKTIRKLYKKRYGK